MNDGGQIVHRLRRVAKCEFCDAEHRFLCDYPLPGGDELARCLTKLCAVCVTRMGSRDYCPAHAEEVRKQR